MLKYYLKVLAFLSFFHIPLIILGFPLPHIDLNCYTEPAWMLAYKGVIAAPATQYTDLTASKTFFLQPPLYFLLLAGYLKIFGFSSFSLLLFTHIIHLFFLIVLWHILKFRFLFPQWIAVIGIISIFPAFSHGRPDFLSLLLGALAWNFILKNQSNKNTIISGILIGLSILTSTSYGISSYVIVATSLLCTKTKKKIHKFFTFSLMSLLIFLAIFSIILILQGKWSIGIEQYLRHLAVRGEQLNRLPRLINKYGLMVSVIPLFCLTIFPFFYSIYKRFNFKIIFSFGASALAWFFLSKAAFLLGHHFTLLARPIFHCEWLQKASRFRWLVVFFILIYTSLLCYHQEWHVAFFAKKGWIEIKESLFPENSVIAVDSVLFPYLHTEKSRIHYELLGETSWPLYLAKTNKNTLKSLKRLEPLQIDFIAVTALTLMRCGFPDLKSYKVIRGNFPPERFKLLGRNLLLAKSPLEIFIFERIK